MEKKINERKTWYKLDLSANVYPTLQRRNFSNVYRLSIVLKEDIDPGLLQKAVDLTLPRFPAFKVALHKGLFWRYFEPNNRPGPFVMPDIVNPCMPMSFKANNGYLLRLYYYRRKISLETFHSLSDGNGTLCLLRTITAVYLRLKGHAIPDGNGVMDLSEAPGREEMEDAYLRYASSKVKSPRKRGNAYRVRGHKEPFYTLNIIQGLIPTDQILQLSRSYKVSVTEYLNAVLLYALLQKQKSDRVFREKPVTLAMPVNLRRFFPSKTLRNFITMVYPSIDPRMGDYTFEEILVQVHHYMRYYINSKFLNADITTNVAAQQSFLIRLVPLFLKDFVVRQFYIRVQDHQSSAGLTNLGVVQVPEEMKEHVERFEVLMGQPFSPRTNCAVISYGNVLSISFTSSIVETDVERYFFRKLVQDGIHVKIETNRNINPDINRKL
ncbi:MAG: alcohol acetyltransferase [Lachnospiraceae bacterium]|nr:alcohol acetyltransferase [Lachnospiraceae bacterium]